MSDERDNTKKLEHKGKIYGEQLVARSYLIGVSSLVTYIIYRIHVFMKRERERERQTQPFILLVRGSRSSSIETRTYLGSRCVTRKKSVLLL